MASISTELGPLGGQGDGKAEATARRIVDRMFAGRKGHGGGPCSYINLDREDLTTIIATVIGEATATARAENKRLRGVIQKQLRLTETRILRLSGTINHHAIGGEKESEQIARDDLKIELAQREELIALLARTADGAEVGK